MPAGSYFYHYLFDEASGFEFPAQLVLRGCATGYADLGECLYAFEQIKPGDHRSWVQELTGLAERAREQGAMARSAGHTVSARDAYRRACNYYAFTYREQLAWDDWAGFRSAFAEHRASWDRACELTDPMIERRSVHLDGADLDAWFFPCTATGEQRPTLLYFSGADALITETTPHALAARERGYNMVAVEGPGQGTTLMDDGIPFRPDWEHVIPPVLQQVTGWSEVDAGAVFLYGASQGGYFCLRGGRAAPSLRGIILDPPVHDVSAAAGVTMSELARAMGTDPDGDLGETLEVAADWSPAVRQMMNWRTFGFGTTTAELEDILRQYVIDPADFANLTTPLLLLDPVGEHFWPGQGREIEAMAGGPVTRAHLTADQGADSHCQPLAPWLIGATMFDWMDAILDQGGVDRPSCA